ncbi:MAG: hypothetical protein ACLFVI_06855 [Archaeoglobaceae archaeon]
MDSKLKILLVMSVLVVLLAFIVPVKPAHNLNIQHFDDRGDADDDIDILWIRSSDYGDYILLEMKVNGQINDTCRYGISVVAKKTNQDEGFIYRCTFFDGQIEQYDLFYRIKGGDTLQILFPKAYLEDSYMIGLEATAHGEQSDFCKEGEERHNDIRRAPLIS